VTIQGQLTYRVADPRKLATLLNLTIRTGGSYVSEDPKKLGLRLLNEAQMAAKVYVAGLTLPEVLHNAERIGEVIMTGLQNSPAVQMLGIEPLSASILNVAPTPEMSRALEAEARESLQKRADDAIYARRNNAVEQERKIKESELATQIVVEEKNRQIRETRTAADIAVEESRRRLIDVKADNERKDADTKAYALDAILKPLSQVEWKTLLALGKGGMDPKVIISHAFRELAENAEKIGTLNITPDLLESVMAERKKT